MIRATSESIAAETRTTQIEKQVRDVVAPGSTVSAVECAADKSRPATETTRSWMQSSAVPASLMFACLVFVADSLTPLGVASGVPYSLAVLLALNSGSRRYVVSFAVLCSLLTLVDLMIGPGRGGSELWKVLTNRSMAISMIWITTILGLKRHRAERYRRRAEAQTRSHLADLAHLSRVETAGQLATTLAHELNQPLSAISLQSEIAVQLAAQQPESQHHPMFTDAMHEIAEQSQRAAAIVKTLRAMVRKTPPRKTAVNLNEVARNVAQLMDTQVRHANVTLRLNLGSSPTVKGDTVQLEQVVLNLLQNSLDAIEAADTRFRRIELRTESLPSGEIEVGVRDTGVGLSDDDCERVFDRFFTSKSDGMGMGLAICRSIIESHNGRMWAAGNEDRGTTFCFRLPAASAN